VSSTDVDFQTIYETFQPRISRYLASLVGDQEAEDVTQEVFTKVNRGLSNFRGESQLSTWLYRIATNAAVDRLRSPSHKQTVMSEEELIEVGKVKAAEAQAENMTDESSSVDGQLVRKEMNECIRDFVDRLPANYRTVLVLSELEGMKNREVAEILGISLETVKIRLHRARAKLKEELGRECTFYRDERDELACDRKQSFE
jgi:RNA polymerase sigma-70 factor (ECF subfamily)